jgi:hypothetical protein
LKKDHSVLVNQYFLVRWLALNGGIRRVSLNERGKAVNHRGGKGGQEKGKAWGEGLLTFWGRASFFRGEDYIVGWVDCYRGASVAKSFGLGGQESLRNLGARESDRLCS